MNELEKTFNPKQIESKWEKAWEKNGYANPNGSPHSFCIMLPPPNVTGTLHMGHGFQCTLMDALIRYHRMQGDNTLWQAGTDHAGIATQMVVERQLAAENITRHDLGRDAFLKKVWAWKKQSGDIITQQIRRLGASIDWSRERFTMDDNVSFATMTAFVKLYEEGLIYRGKKLVNWDPQLHTAISDLEVSSEMEKGHLWHIRYPIENSNDCLIVATTRPETMLGDTAVAVNPKDERYQQYIGKKIRLPLSDRLIPIIGDDYVDQEFGTGCVKITPAHDFNDHAIGERHQLPIINILTIDAKINDNAPEKYQGLDRFVARKKIVADLQELNLLEKIVDHEHMIPRGDRSGVVIEPLLTDQWFVKMGDMAKKAIDAFQKKEITFVPENWGNIYLQWLSNIQDWCISRQLWWGHRIPVWYDDQGNHYVGLHEQDVREKNKLTKETKLKQDDDVLDTWFSAALWPFATLGWPDDNAADLNAFYPTSVLVTGFDIIFFWVARMVMFGLKFTGRVPFKQVYITGLIRDSQGQKMSKSKGNVLDPVDLIDGITLEKLIEKRTTGMMQPQLKQKIENQTKKEFADGIPESGTDALRFTFCALATTGRNINFDIARLTGYRNFCNKIWNATRFVMMNVEGDVQSAISDTQEKSVASQWILHELEVLIGQVNGEFAHYRFDNIATLLYEFVWNTYCDWYLELAKCDLAIADKKASTQYTLLYVLEVLMRLLHPVMPFITEEIWQQIAPMLKIQGETIMLQPYPSDNPKKISELAKWNIDSIKNLVTKIRTMRSENRISPAHNVDVILDGGVDQEMIFCMNNKHYIEALAKCQLKQKWKDEILPECIHDIIPHNAGNKNYDLHIYIPMAGLIDPHTEIARITREIEKQEKLLAPMQARLDNTSFTEKAPKEVVDKLREQCDAAQRSIANLHEQHEKIKKLV